VTADDVVIEALAPLIGSEVSVLVELRTGDDEWALLAAQHGVLRGPFGPESGADWFIGEHGALSIPQNALERARRDGPVIVFDYGGVRVAVRPDAP
jgi:hypothetical protein